MKNMWVSLTILAALLVLCTSVKACNIFKTKFSKTEGQNYVREAAFENQEVDLTGIEVLPTMNSESSAQNRIWVGTFQLVWNDAIDSLVKKPIEFVDGFNQTAADLNKRELNKEDISESSYYIKSGIISPELKAVIEKGIKEKFNETSDVLDMIDFSYNPEKYLFYAMLKKDFKFLEPFDKLEDEKFGANPALVKYFGVNEDSSSKLYKNVSVLFYNTNKDYAVSIHTQDNDEVILYRTNDDKKFNEYYADLKDKTKDFDGSQFFGSYDRLKVPDIKLYQITSFKDLEGKNVKDSDLRIDKTLETVDFRMNNEGVKLKSEALMVMRCTALPGPAPMVRKFYFNDRFVLFLIEKGKNVPYFAMRVSDVEALNKTGKPE
jgi:hypothetical protein